MGAEYSQALQRMLIGSYQRDSAHNIPSWKIIQGWTTSTNRTRKIPMVLKHLFPGGEGSTAVPFSQERSTSSPTGHRAQGELMWCVGKSTVLDGETWVLHPALHQPVGILGKPLYLPNQRNHFQVH